MNPGQQDVIVVGVDGSPASQAALRWALRHAARDEATVTAVEVGHPTRLAASMPFAYAAQRYGMAPPIERATGPSPLHESVIAATRAVRGAPRVDELRVDGDPAVELARIAQGASMLVLGRTPHGRLAEFILGSVAGECLRRARCPVVLIAPDAT